MDIIDTLRDELTNDPETRGYAGMTDQQAFDSLTGTIDRPAAEITGKEIFAAQNNTDYNGLTDAKKSQWIALTAHDSIDPFGPAVQVAIDIWGGGSQTIADLNTLRNNYQSRAQELGLNIKLAHVIEARA